MKFAARLRAALAAAFLIFGLQAFPAPPPATNSPSGELCGTTRAWLRTEQGREYLRQMSLTGTCPIFGSCDNPANRDANVPAANAAVKIVRLRFQVFANDDGSNVAATPAEIQSEVDQLNSDYESSRIQFVYTMRNINSTLYRNCASNSENALKIFAAENPSQQINVFVTRYAGFDNCGIATFPWTAAAGTATGGIMLQDFSVNPVKYSVQASFHQCISHEMGHALGLVHTFHGVTEIGVCQDCRELVGRSTADGDRTGDFCSDTAPDPGITILSGTCNVAGTNDPCNGQPFVGVDTQNFMSYYQSCYSRFTTQQRGRMHCWMGTAPLNSEWSYDNVDPSVAISAPTNGTYIITPNISGTASDDVGVKRVRVALARSSDGAWWDWNANVFGSTTFDFALHAKWATGSASWSAALPALPDGAYEVQAQSVDFGDHSSSWVARQFTVDGTAPTIAFSPLTNQETVFNFDQVGGTISEPGTVKFKIEWFKSGGNQFWNGVNWSTDEAGALLAADVSGLNWTPASGTLPSRFQIAQANYLVYAYVTDAAGLTNTANIVLTRSPADTTPPLVTLNIANGDIITNSFLAPLQGFASDAESGVDLVQCFFMRSSVVNGFDYWNGSSWTATPTALSCYAHDGLWELPVGTVQPSGANLANGNYTVQVSARNREAPQNTTLISVNFVVDYHPIFTWTAGSYSDGDPDNNNDNWGNPANWSPYGVPTPDANVFINGNVESRSLGSITVNGLTFNGGTLYASNLNVKLLTHNAGRLHVENQLQLADNGLFKWNGGDLYGGSAKLGSFNNPVSGTCLISNATGKALYSATFNNSGTVRWFDGPIYGDESVINNGPTGTWEASAASTLDLYPNFGAGNRGFVNYGTFRKLGAFDTAHQGHFTNYGTIEASAGLFTLYDYITWQDGSRITGAGAVRLVNGCCGAFATLAGNVTLDSTFDLAEWNTYIRGTANLNITSNGVLKLSAGFLGGNVNVTGDGQIVWNGGGFDGTNTVGVTIDATGNLTKWFNRYNNDGFVTLNTYGAVNWGGNGLILGVGRLNYGEHPGVWNNSGTIRFVGDGVTFNRDGDYPLLNNFGTLTKISGTNETTIHSFLINNFANINAQTGTLAFVDVVNLQTNSSLNGVSLIRFAGNITASNIVTASGRVRMDGGTFNAATNGSGALSAWRGTNIFEWMGGTLYGHHVIGSKITFNIADPAATVATKYLGSGTTVDNDGMMTWSGVGRVHAWGRGNYDEYPSTLNNRAGATFRLLNDGYPFSRDGDYTRFTNCAGALFVKTGGTNRTTIDSWLFANSGEVRADVGTNEFTDLVIMQPGGRFAGAGTHLISAGNHTILGTNVIDGTTVEQSGGTITGNSNSVATLRTMNNGLWRWSGGTIAERTAWASGSAMEIAGSATKFFASGAVLDNSANVRFLGDGQIFNYGRGNYGEVPATWNNLSGGVFDAQADGIITYNGTTPNFNNLAGATFRKTAGTNTIVYWALNNAGIVQCSTGRIELAGGGLGGTGTFLADAGARVKFTGGNYTLANATLGGDGKIQVDGATVTTVGNVTFNSPASLDVISGTMNGFGNFTGATVVNWTGGWIGGTQHIAAGSVFNISGAPVKYLASGTVLNNEGVINWSGPGQVYAWARGNYGEFPSQINNLASGSIRFLTDGSPFVRDGDYSRVNNFGALTKVDGTNETSIDSFIVNNFGSIISQTGTLAFVDYVNLGTNSQIIGASAIRFGGLITLSNTVTASGLVRMNGGWFNAATNADATVQGAWLGSNTFEWMGGTLYGHHTFGSNVVVNITDPPGSSATKFLGSLVRIDNYGRMNWSGSGTIYAWARNNYGEFSSIIENRPGATFRFLNDGIPFTRDGDYSFLTNHPGALVVKSGGTNRTTIQGFQLANRGELRADVGALEFSDVLHLEDGGKLSGNGTNLISAGNHTIDGTTTVDGQLVMSDGTLTGLSNAVLTAGAGNFEWRGGWIGGEFTFGSGLLANLSGNNTKAFSPAATIHNRGTIRWTGSGNIWSPGRGNYGELPMTFLNENGAKLIAENDAGFDTWGSPHAFSNLLGATFIKTNATGTTWNAWLFNNEGTVSLDSGVLQLNQTPSFGASSALKFALGGTTAGVGYGQLIAPGNVALNGSLSAMFKPGFTPALSNAFTLVTYGSETGTFAPLNLPLLPPDLVWSAGYGANAFTLNVGRAFVAVAPARLGNGHFQFTLQGPVASRAIIDASADLISWTPIETNVPFTGTFLLDDPGAVTQSNRFYRIRIEP